ncbi:PQQ-binding-like beta-propeller repeat protein [Ilumatobacter fluminis]|uniref:outer membrane protein assembly factor BamB family protein n=1 Tax=Ilumatobacter fluminis TaxID=467091 RepID=UPI0014152E90|nr:PQQ-binding-like beta-propeller repeat protein [Ilumatobacter fluminis]
MSTSSPARVAPPVARSWSGHGDEIPIDIAVSSRSLSPSSPPPGMPTDPPGGWRPSGRQLLVAAAVVVATVAATTVWATKPSADRDVAADERAADDAGGYWTLAPSIDTGPGAPEIPPGAEPRWTLDPTADRDAPIAWGRTAMARVVAAEIIVYDLADGDLKWRAPFVGSDPAIAFSDEAAVVVTTTGGTDVTIVGFDPADGTLLWRRRNDHAIAVPGPGAPVVFDGRRDAVVMRVLDPLTGDEVGHPAEAVTMSTATPYVVALVGDLFAVLDLRNGTRVGPAVPADGLEAIAPIGQHIVGVSDVNELVLFDADGEVADRRPFADLTAALRDGPDDEDGDSRGTTVDVVPELVGEVPGTSLGIVAGGTSVGFDVSSGRIEPVWEVDGRVRPPVETEIGPVAATRIVDAETGHVGHSLIDARNGSTIAMTDTGIVRAGTPVIGADGFVVATAFGEHGRSVSAFGFDGDERWHVSLPPAASFEVAPGTLLVLEPSGSISAFS